MSVGEHGDGAHRYHVRCEWSGSTAVGYERYDRTHDVVAPPAEAALQVSADPAFCGSADRLNPEQLLVMAVASCQLLSFLAVAARARLDVVAYRDEAEGVMVEGDPPVRIESITLRPTITVAGRVDEARVRHLVEVAHRECYIANSLSCAMSIEATVVVRGVSRES